MNYLKLLRINNWVKNLFIFIPLFFSAELFEFEKLIATSVVIIGFSFVASFVYVVNDVFDVEFDKNHPTKKNRPIASGRLSVNKSLITGFTVLFSGLTIVYLVSVEAFYFTLFYVVLNFFYSYKLKHVAIIDFIVVAFGFVLRILIGGVLGGIILTQWILLLVFLLSLFIAITKRRDDVFQYEEFNNKNRKVIDQYSVEFMDRSITIISSVLIVTYLLFISSEDVLLRYQSDYLFITFIPVLIGIFRYNQITYVFNKSGSPIKILYNDRFLQLVIVSWLSIFALILY